MHHLAWTVMLCSSATAQRWEQVSIIELNRVKQGGWERFSQVVLWVWNPEYRRHEVAAWWMLEDFQTQAPVKINGRWVVRYRGINFWSDIFHFTEGEDSEWRDRKRRGEVDRVRFW